MNVTVLEDFPVELFDEIFVYLTSYDLLRGFENLNYRFSWMISGQKLGLPTNRGMSREVYSTYLTSILPMRQSQVVYLNLSERRAPDAVKWFLQMGVNLFLSFPLRALSIECVSRQTFEMLLSHLHLLPHLHSVSIDIGKMRWYSEEYSDLSDIHYLLPILKTLPELRTLRLRQSPTRSSSCVYDELALSLPIACHLRTLSINSCSHQLVVVLLLYSLPELCCLNVCFEFNDRHSLPMSVPLNWNCLPELRSVKFTNAPNFRWVLTLFGDVYQHGQLTELVLSNSNSTIRDNHIVTAKELHQWFMMSTKCVDFRLNLRGYNYAATSNTIKALLIDYKTVFNARFQWNEFDSFDIFIHYSKERISHDISSKNDRIETPFESSSSLFEGELWDRCHDEIRLDLHGWTSQLDVAQFALNNALPLLTNIVKQMLPVRIRKLYINSNINTWLSSLIIATHGSSTKLFDDTRIETVRLDGIDISLVKIAHQVVGLFGGIKKLTLWIKDTLDVTLDDLQLAIQQIVQGLPTLVYFSCIVHSQSTRAVDFQEISPWILAGGLNRPVSFRSKRYLLDFWL